MPSNVSVILLGQRDAIVQPNGSLVSGSHVALASNESINESIECHGRDRAPPATACDGAREPRAKDVHTQCVVQPRSHAPRARNVAFGAIYEANCPSPATG